MRNLSVKPAASHAKIAPWRNHEKNKIRVAKHGNCGLLASHNLGSSRTKPLAALLDKYLQHLAIKGFAESTLRVRRVYMEMFLTWCKKYHATVPAQINRSFLDSYQGFLFQYRKRDGQSLAMTSQHSRLASLKTWFKWLAQRNYIRRDPASELELPRVAYKLPDFLNKDQAELVLRQPDLESPMGVRDRALLELLYSTGIRRMEIPKLRLYDVDQQNGLVSIREGKGKRDRVVPVGQRAIAWLEKYVVEVRPLIVRKPDEGIIFLTTLGRQFSPNYLSWLARRYVQAADMGKSGACHIFRHTMATLMLEGGADTRYIQAMLGHARLDTTQIYTHVSIRMLKHIHTTTHPAARLDVRTPIPAADQLPGNPDQPRNP